MADKNFKPEKSATDVGRFGSMFNSSVSQMKAKDATSKIAAGDAAHAQHVNRTDWEVPYDSEVAGTPHD